MTITRILFEWNCIPLSHVLEGSGRLYYAHAVEGGYACVEVSNEALERLTTLQIDVRSLFDNEPIFFYPETMYNNITLKPVKLENVVDDLPERGVKLYV